jgi:hypothetical protein
MVRNENGLLSGYVYRLCASGSVLIWPFLAERRHASATANRSEQLERRTQRLVAVSLFALAAYIIGDAA